MVRGQRRLSERGFDKTSHPLHHKSLTGHLAFNDKRSWFVFLHLQRVDVARVPCGFFAADVRLELRCQVERKCLVFCTAWLIHCLVVPVSLISSMLLQVELRVQYCQKVVDVLGQQVGTVDFDNKSRRAFVPKQITISTL